MTGATALSDTSTDEARTLDAFHRGAFHLVQPAGRGHRAGMDAMMLAAAVPAGFAGQLADLGAGAGAVGMAVAARCPAARVTLIERSPEMADCARRTVAHPLNAHIADRARVLEADVTLTGRARATAGLADATFDYAVMNPPFNAADDRPSTDALRRDAHVMADGLLEAWLRTAAAILRPRGGVALIARPQSLTAILAAMAGRFGGAQVLAIHPRSGEPAIRIVVRATKGSRAALSLMPPLFVHEEPGDRFSARADAINNGGAALFGD